MAQDIIESNFHFIMANNDMLWQHVTRIVVSIELLNYSYCVLIVWNASCTRGGYMAFLFQESSNGSFYTKK